MTGKKGIDVSAHQGTIDWDKVQRSGVTFAILRAGYGNDISQKDPTFDKNLREAQRRNIPCGAYWFSYAVSESDARKEAKTCMEALRGTRLEYPVYFDFEYDSVRYASEHGVTVTKKLATTMAKAFLEELEKGGYTAGYYANPDYLSRFFDDSQLKQYELWLACWSEKMPESRAGLWQYSDSGSVSGVLGKTDMDRSFADYPKRIKEAGKNGFSKPAAKSEEKQPATSKAKKSAAATGKTTAATASKSVKTTSTSSKKSMAKKSQNSVITMAAVRLRKDAETSSKILTTIPKGKTLSHLQDDGWGWSRVRYGKLTGWAVNRCLTGRGLSAYKTGICHGDGVNFRGGPSLTAPVCRQLRRGQIFSVVCVQPSGWLHVLLSGQEGYVYYDPSYIEIR